MHARFVSGSGQTSAGLLVHVTRLALLTLPFSLFLAVSLRLPPGRAGLLWLGTLFLGLACVLSLGLRQGWREPIGPAVIMLYVIALSWLVLGTNGVTDWFLHLARAVLLVVPLGCFAVQCLRLGRPRAAARPAPGQAAGGARGLAAGPGELPALA
jgi:hypothetical protein